MLDLSAAPKHIQKLMDEGHTIDEAIVEADHVGIHIEYHVFDDEILLIEFFHRPSGTRWFARFTGYDAELVEVFGLVDSWEG